MPLEDGEVEDVVCDGRVCRGGVVEFVVGGLGVVGGIDGGGHGGGVCVGGV